MAKQKSEGSYFEKLESEVSSNQSRLSLVLGGLIVVVVGILVFNYFNRQTPELGPAQQSTETEGDVSPENLPGKYTVKEGDTLFVIADKYYKDGYKYTDIAKENELANVNSLEVGQVLEIPKLEDAMAQASPEASMTPESGEAEPAPQNVVPAGEKGAVAGTGTGGGDTTIWGPKIEGDTYTVVKGDWLSTIAARAYGDIYSYDKIAKANNISNPDVIEVGQVLKLPR